MANEFNEEQKDILPRLQDDALPWDEDDDNPLSKLDETDNPLPKSEETSDNKDSNYGLLNPEKELGKLIRLFDNTKDLNQDKYRSMRMIRRFYELCDKWEDINIGGPFDSMYMYMVSYHLSGMQNFEEIHSDEMWDNPDKASQFHWERFLKNNPNLSEDSEEWQRQMSSDEIEREREHQEFLRELDLELEREKLESQEYLIWLEERAVFVQEIDKNGNVRQVGIVADNLITKKDEEKLAKIRNSRQAIKFANKLIKHIGIAVSQIEKTIAITVSKMDFVDEYKLHYDYDKGKFRPATEKELADRAASRAKDLARIREEVREGVKLRTKVSTVAKDANTEVKEISKSNLDDKTKVLDNKTKAVEDKTKQAIEQIQGNKKYLDAVKSNVKEKGGYIGHREKINEKSNSNDGNDGNG